VISFKLAGSIEVSFVLTKDSLFSLRSFGSKETFQFLDWPFWIILSLDFPLCYYLSLLSISPLARSNSLWRISHGYFFYPTSSLCKLFACFLNVSFNELAASIEVILSSCNGLLYTLSRRSCREISRRRLAVSGDFYPWREFLVVQTFPDAIWIYPLPHQIFPGYLPTVGCNNLVFWLWISPPDTPMLLL